MAEKSQIQWTGRSLGRIKQFCSKNGISLSLYKENTISDLKWCTACKDWHKKDFFLKDKSRFDGLVASCSMSRNTKARLKYKPKPRPMKGRKYVSSRDLDAKQARRRVNYLVEQGLIPHPNKLPCVDCGHEYKNKERRHEYDHYMGYNSENHEKVEPVCSKCHKKRTNGEK